MYIKLTKTDGRPIWLNASFIVTVEPMQNGGTIVVPIGDGLDYEVRESPETVLAMLGDAPPPAVVPVPPPKSLAPQPEDVSPEDQDEKDAVAAHKKDEGRKASKKPAQKTQRKKAAVAKQAQKKEEPPKSQASSAGADVKAIAVKLKANKCRTENRLRNFIKSCYKKADEAEVSRVVDAMKKDGYIVVKEDGHISWTEVV